MKMFGFDTLDWRQVKIDWDAITDDIIKAGTPMDKDGHICNDGNVFGILMDDVQRKRNVQGRVVISGCMDMKAAEAHSGITLSAEAKAALPDIWTQGGATSWNDLTDKPFDETVVYGDTLTWDGNTDGLVPVGGIIFKVSDAVITKEDCANGLSLTFAGQTITVSGEEAQAIFADDGFATLEYVTFVPTDNYAIDDSDVIDVSLVFPEAGVYFFSREGIFASELVIPGYEGFAHAEIEKLDKKFLPEHIHSFKSLTDKPFYAERNDEVILAEITGVPDPDMDNSIMLSAVLDVMVGNVYSVNWNGVEYLCELKDINGGKFLGDVGLVTGTGSTGEPFVIVIDPTAVGIMPLDGSASVTVSINGTTVQPLSPTYLPRMIVTFVNGENGNLVSDKTLEQIITALDAGMLIEGRYIVDSSVMCLPLVAVAKPSNTSSGTYNFASLMPPYYYHIQGHPEEGDYVARLNSGTI